MWSHAASLKIALYMISPVAPSLSLPRKKRILPKILIFLVLLLVLGCLGIGSWFYRTAHSSLAQLDGLIAVAGLNAPVSVVRDAQGVPHLTAASLEDLFAARLRPNPALPALYAAPLPGWRSTNNSAFSVCAPFPSE